MTSCFCFDLFLFCFCVFFVLGCGVLEALSTWRELSTEMSGCSFSKASLCLHVLKWLRICGAFERFEMFLVGLEGAEWFCFVVCF